MRWVGELARRKVLKVGAVYLATAWVLLQLTDIVAPALELPAWTLKFVLLLLVLGFPVAVVLAWQFNLTGHGLEAEAADAERPPRTRKRDWALLGVMAVLGIGAGVAAQRMLTTFGDAVPTSAATTPAPAKPAGANAASVAVLPFVNMGGVAEDGYFADGLSEEILNSLANVAGLKVAGRTSSFSYKGRDQDIRKIGRELGVAHVIEGSVRRQGDKLRVTAQLIKADDGFHLWSQTFDRTLDDTLAIQSEIAAAVADKLKLSVLPATSGAAALEGASQQAYLQALGLISESSPPSLQRAIALLRPLQRAHPDFIPVYLPLADSVQRLGWWGSVPWVKAVEEMRALSTEATRRAPRNLDARVLAALIAFAENDLAPSYRRYEGILAAHRALADEAPNHPLLQLNTADAARIVDQNELALRYVERYIALEPRDPKGQSTLGVILGSMGRTDEAVAAFHRATELSPRFIGGYWEPTRLLTRSGRYAEALGVVERCQRNGAPNCAPLLGDMFRILRQPALEQRAESLDPYPQQAKQAAFEAARRRGGYRGALAWLESQGDEAESLKRWFGNDLTTAALEAGEYDALFALRAWLSPGALDPGQPLLEWNLEPALEIGVALKRTGRDAEARALFERVLQAATRVASSAQPRWSHQPDVIAKAWLGDIDGALALLRRRVAAGWVCEYYLQTTNAGTPDPLIEPLRDHPEFQRLMREVREKNARAFAALKASGRPLVPNLKPLNSDIAQR